MEQLVQPNIEIVEKAGYCLQYARRVFGAPAVEPTAYVAWKNARHKHHNRNFPQGVSFPVWFEWWGDLGGGRQRYDHVAVYHTDGKVWSSPLTGHGRAWFESIDDLTRAFGGGMKYLGWSEDISGVRVVEEKDMVTQTGINYLFRSLLGRDCDTKQAKDLMKVHTFDSLEAWIKKLPEYKKRVADAKTGKVNLGDHLARAYRPYYKTVSPEFEEVKDKLYRRK